jgi:hypothetical protein
MIRAVLTLALFGAGPALAQGAPDSLTLNAPCAPADAVKAIMDAYREAPSASAMVTADGKPFGPMILTRNTTTGSFSIFIMSPDGKACMAMAGEAWKSVDQ